MLARESHRAFDPLSILRGMKRGYKGHFFLFEQGTSEETLIDKNPTDVNPGTMAAIGVMFDLWSDLLGDRNITHFEGCRPSHARLLTGDVKCCCLRRIGGGSHAETSTATARNALSSVSAGEPCIKIIDANCDHQHCATISCFSRWLEGMCMLGLKFSILFLPDQFGNHSCKK